MQVKILGCEKCNIPFKVGIVESDEDEESILVAFCEKCGVFTQIKEIGVPQSTTPSYIKKGKIV
jgi:RNase P subunit RPR2